MIRYAFLTAVLVTVAQTSQCPTECPDDQPSCSLLLDDYACGSDVVGAVITRLKTCDIFREDHQFLRRLAFVETRDGADENTFTRQESGGIWGLHEDKLDVLHNDINNETVWTVVSECIAMVVTVNKGREPEVPRVDFLNKPLLSGLAAGLYLYYLKFNGAASIPLAGNIEGQARFWKTYYHSGNLREEDFIQRVYILEREGKCTLNFRDKVVA